MPRTTELALRRQVQLENCIIVARTAQRNPIYFYPPLDYYFIANVRGGKTRTYKLVCKTKGCSATKFDQRAKKEYQCAACKLIDPLHPLSPQNKGRISIDECTLVGKTGGNGDPVYHYKLHDLYFIESSSKPRRWVHPLQCNTDNCTAMTYSTKKQDKMLCRPCSSRIAIKENLKKSNPFIAQLLDPKRRTFVGYTVNGKRVYRLKDGDLYSKATLKGKKTVDGKQIHTAKRVIELTCPGCKTGEDTRYTYTHERATEATGISYCAACNYKRLGNPSNHNSTRFIDNVNRHKVFGEYMDKLTNQLTHQGTAVALGGDEVSIELQRLTEYNEYFKTIRIYDFTDDSELARDIQQKVDVCNLTSARRTYAYKHADMFMFDEDMDDDLVFANIDTQRQMTDTLIYDVSQYLLTHASTDKPLAFMLNTVNRSAKGGSAKKQGDDGWHKILSQLKDNGYEVLLNLGRTTYMGGSSMNLYGATVIPRIQN